MQEPKIISNTEQSQFVTQSAPPVQAIGFHLDDVTNATQGLLQDVDAIAHLQLHYSPQHITTGTIDLVLTCNHVKRILQVHPSGTEVVRVPFFTPTCPFITACFDTVSITADPPPLRISGLGIRYPSDVYYRLISSPHTFPLCPGWLIEYSPHTPASAQIKIIPEVQ